MKTASGQTVIVNAGVQQRQSVLIQPANAGQLLLSQGIQGQVQLVQSSQSGQYVIQTNASQGMKILFMLGTFLETVLKQILQIITTYIAT